MDFNISDLKNLKIEELTNELYPHLELFNDLIEDEDYEAAQTLLQNNDELCQYIILLYAASNCNCKDSSFVPTLGNLGYVQTFIMQDNQGSTYELLIEEGALKVTQNK